MGKDQQIVAPICICGAHTSGPAYELRLAGWTEQDGTDLCPRYPQCMPKKEKEEFDF